MRLARCIVRGTSDESDHENNQNSLIVEDESDCDKISQNHWSTILISSYRCSSINDGLTIDGYSNLTRLAIYKGALNGLTSLTISNNPVLTEVSFLADDMSYNELLSNLVTLTISSSVLSFY